MYTKDHGFSGMILWLLILCLAAPVFALSPSAQAETLSAAPLSIGDTRDGMVRVYLSSLGNPEKLDITVSGSYSVNGNSNQSLASGSKVTVRFSPVSGKLTLTWDGSTRDMGSSFALRRHASAAAGGLRIAQSLKSNNLYPGDLSFKVQYKDGAYKLYVITHVYIEDYLYGVLPYEMNNACPLEALKAQAVCARTYTLRFMGSSSRLYDVVDTPTNQVYRGTPSGNTNCKMAVDQTKGIILKNGSSLTATYYTASNGGQTESVRNIWGSTSYDYLIVKDDPYDFMNPDSRVKSFVIQKENAKNTDMLRDLINNKAAYLWNYGTVVTDIHNITLHSPKYPAPSRLYTKADFDVTAWYNGSSKRMTMTFDVFNELEEILALSLNSGKNELWTVNDLSSSFRVEARRWGHGAGMSQRGAMQMGNLGYTYDQILNFYFEGCTRVQYSFTRSILSTLVPGQSSNEEISVETAAPIEGTSPDLPSNQQLAKVTTKSGSLNLRSDTSTTSRVLCTIPRNTVISINKVLDGWCQTSYNGHTGYVMSSFLTFVNAVPTVPAVTPEPPPAGGLQARVTTRSGSLNLRQYAGTGTAVLRTIPQNQVIPIYEKGDLWCRTSYKGTDGYVMTKFLTFLQSGPTAPPVIVPTQPPASGTTYAQVTTRSGSLNLRESGSTRARVLDTIPQYAVISLSEIGPVWCKTTYQGTTGYVMTSFLTIGVTPEITPPEGNTLIARVTTASGSLNLRDRASTYGSVLMTIPRHTEIPVYEKGSIWCKVEYQGVSGYVMRKFLTFISDPQPTKAPAPTQFPIPTNAPVITPVSTLHPVSPDAPLNPLPAPIAARINSRSDSLNLRTGPAKTFPLVMEMPKGDFLLIYAMNDVWCQVQYEGKEGFCMKEFLILPHGY